VESNPFAFSPGQLNKMLNPKSLAALTALGGLKGLEKGLRTSLTAGLSIDETTLHGKVSFEEVTNLLREKHVDFIRPIRSQTQATGQEVRVNFMIVYGSIEITGYLKNKQTAFGS